MLQLLPDKEDRLFLSPYDLISLKETGIRGGTFALRKLDHENLESLLISNPQTWPAIKVTLTSLGYVLIDGYHRWEVAKRKRLDQLLATCEPFFCENDIVEAAFRANLSHGLKASWDNKSDYAYWLHLTYPEMEQADIAKRVGISQPSVSKAIARREAEVRQARQVEGELDEKTRKRQIKKACRTLTRVAMRFLKEVEGEDEEELNRTLQEIIKKNSNQTKLALLGRLLLAQSSGEQ